jgi:nucleotide-binding universal stress UspA family protein
MISTILLAVDGSGHARRAVDLGIDIAARYGAKLVILAAHPHGPLSGPLADFASEEDLSAAEVYQRIVKVMPPQRSWPPPSTTTPT